MLFKIISGIRAILLLFWIYLPFTNYSICRFNNKHYSGKRILIAPYNRSAVKLSILIKKDGGNIIGFVDNVKEGDGIYRYDDISELKIDILLINCPTYWDEIAKSVAIEKISIIFNIGLTTYYFPFSSTKKDYQMSEMLQIADYNYNQIKSRIRKARTDIERQFNICLTKNSSRIKLLKDIHFGKRAFIIGTGPSLTINDLDMLHNEISFSCNKIYLAYEKTNWRPDYYIIEDPLDILEYLEIVIKNEYYSQIFIPEQCYDKKIKYDDIITYYNSPSPSLEKRGFSFDMSKCIYGGESVIYSMMQIFCHMGIKDIYLLGIDFNYFVPDKINTYIYSQGEQNHFHPDYRHKGDIWVEPRLENSIIEYKRCREICKKNGINIFNATRGGSLEVFERVDLDYLFEK